MDELLARCLAFFQQHQTDAYLVGGTVRDQLLGRDSHDLDFVVPAHALSLARALANELGGAFYALDAERETARIVMPDRASVDVALMRGATIDADLAARDFTLNALARPARDMTVLLDPFHGADDLRARLLRAVHEQSFVGDPVRLVRAMRIAHELDCAIEPHTQQLMQRDLPLLSLVSGERIRDELAKILQLPGTEAMSALHEHQLLPRILPHAQWNAERQHALPQPTMMAKGALSSFGTLLSDYTTTILSGERTRWVVMRLAPLYDQIADIVADMQRLKFSRHEIELARALVRHAPRFAQLPSLPDVLSVHRFFRDTGDAALGLIVLGIACVLDTSDAQLAHDTAATLLRHYTEAYERVIAPVPLLNGAELSEQFGLRGSEIGNALRTLVEAQVCGAVSTRAQAETYLRDALNLKAKV